MSQLRRRILLLVSLPLSLLAIGTVGYRLIEGWGWIDSFYMAAITITTVGFGEVRPLSDVGRVFTVFLILAGVGIVAYGFGALMEVLLTADFATTLRRRRMSKELGKLKGHVIVCGFGRVGHSAVTSLDKGGRPIVVIERDPERVVDARTVTAYVLEGDATKDETLVEAGIEQAWGLIVCTADDSRNLFIVLSARSLNPQLYIVTRSVEAENERKMRRAGADRVVSPYQIGGKHMANIIIRPHVTDFFDVVTLDGGIELWVEELKIHHDSPLVGQTVGQADVRRRTGVTLVALLRRTQDAAIIPDADTVLEAEDELIVLGTREQMAELEKLTGDVIAGL